MMETSPILFIHSDLETPATMVPALPFQHRKLTATRFLSNNMSLARSPVTRETWARFSTSGTTMVSKAALSTSGKASILGTSLLLLATLSDPFISALESRKEDVNVSYWKMNAKKRESDLEHGASIKGCRLRNAPQKGTIDPPNAATTLNSPPKYSRIVIVGGGMAGLHTALCLAERMHNPHSQEACPPKNLDGWRTKRNNLFSRTQSRKQEEALDVEIIVLDASEIGNGASGRAKGMVVPGFQVPLESLEMNAYDYESKDTAEFSSIPAMMRKVEKYLGIHDSTPRYSKAVVRELYDATYVALERLRDVIQKYNIDCDWVESGGLEASIHTPDEDDEEVKEDRDYDCRILTSQQVDKIMGRHPVSSGKANESDNKHSLYKWGEYNPSCAGVNPFALTLGLADAVERWGVKIYEYTKVAKLEKCSHSSSQDVERSDLYSTGKLGKGKYSLSTTEGHVIHCDHVVLCTGAESGLSKRLSKSFVPVYTWMAATEPLYDKCPLNKEVTDRVLSELNSREQSSTKQPTSSSPHAAPMCGDDHFALNYWRNDNSNEGRLLFGSLCDSFSFPPMFVSWRLRNALREVYPHLSNVKFDHVWGGKLAVALNSMPIVGRDVGYDDDVDPHVKSRTSKYVTEGGVWYNMGFAGHGIVPTALAGSVLANAILGIPDRITSNDASNNDGMDGMHHDQLWQLFHTYFPPSSWNGHPYSRVGSGATFMLYNIFDWLGKKGLPVPRLPEIW